MSDLNALTLDGALGGSAPGLLVLSRFKVEPANVTQFAADARAAIAVLAGCSGFMEATLGQSTDDHGLLTISTRWDQVGSYRRAMSTYEVRVSVIPFLSLAVDESSAYEIVHHRTATMMLDAAPGLAADAGSKDRGSGLGSEVVT